MTSGSGRIPVAAIAGGLFCLALIFLALQIRAGNDPAIGAGTQAAVQPARKVLVKRIVVRRIVELPPKAARRVPVRAVPSSQAGAATAPAAAAPAPAATPPPAAAPPPAPVVSRGS